MVPNTSTNASKNYISHFRAPFVPLKLGFNQNYTVYRVLDCISLLKSKYIVGHSDGNVFDLCPLLFVFVLLLLFFSAQISMNVPHKCITVRPTQCVLIYLEDIDVTAFQDSPEWTISPAQVGHTHTLKQNTQREHNQSIITTIYTPPHIHTRPNSAHKACYLFFSKM